MSERRQFRDGVRATQGELEDEILDRLANAEGDITEDVELICDTFMKFLTTPTALNKYAVHSVREENRATGGGAVNTG